MNVFLERIGQQLPVLSSELIASVAPTAKSVQSADVLVCTAKGLEAKELRTPGGFVVLAGSSAVLKERPDAHKHGAWLALRAKLIADGSLLSDRQRLVFNRDVEFASPSAAAGVVCGGTAASSVSWANKQGKTFKDIKSDT